VLVCLADFILKSATRHVLIESLVGFNAVVHFVSPSLRRCAVDEVTLQARLRLRNKKDGLTTKNFAFRLAIWKMHEIKSENGRSKKGASWLGWLRRFQLGNLICPGG